MLLHSIVIGTTSFSCGIIQISGAKCAVSLNSHTTTLLTLTATTLDHSAELSMAKLQLLFPFRVKKKRNDSRAEDRTQNLLGIQPTFANEMVL